MESIIRLRKLGELVRAEKSACKQAIIDDKDFENLKMMHMELKELEQISNILLQDVAC